MSTVIFAGPSLSRDRIRVITNSRIEDPIRRGDLLKFSSYQTFVILDGEFGQSLSVSPKEILDVVDRGKTVIGASSMGALRASELHTCGMIGIGWVYRRFVQARVRRDDEVALVFSPFDFSPLTVPMVNVEYWLEILQKDGVLGSKQAKAVRQAVGRTFFSERTEASVQKSIDSALGRDTLRKMLEHTGGIPDIKALDAEQAIRAASETGSFLSQKCDTLSFKKGKVDQHARNVSSS